MITPSFLIKNSLAALILPPGGHILLGLASLLLWYRRPRLARGLLAANLLMLWAISTPLASKALIAPLEPAPISRAALTQVDAIVCLGGGTVFGALQNPDERDVNGVTAERVRYADRLARSTGKPLAVTGGTMFQEALSEGKLMARVLQQDYGMTPFWVESQAADTSDNAVFLARKMLPQYRRIALVSGAWHLPRAAQLFSKAGFAVTLAPTSYQTQRPFSLLELLPDTPSLNASYQALHERVGMAWYRRRVLVFLD